MSSTPKLYEIDSGYLEINSAAILSHVLGDKSFEGVDLSQLKLSLMESFLEDDVQGQCFVLSFCCLF